MQECMQQAERKAEQQSIEKIQAYEKYQKHRYREIEKQRAKSDKEVSYQPVETDLSNYLARL